MGGPLFEFDERNDGQYVVRQLPSIGDAKHLEARYLLNPRAAKAVIRAQSNSKSYYCEMIVTLMAVFCFVMVVRGTNAGIAISGIHVSETLAFVVMAFFVAAHFVYSHYFNKKIARFIIRNGKPLDES